jgi:hypothetical protein
MPKRARTQRPPDYLNEQEYQRKVKEGLDRLYRKVTIQWRPFQGEERGIYAPVVDVAVGPFAVTQRYIGEYGTLLDETRGFMGKANRKAQ